MQPRHVLLALRILSMYRGVPVALHGPVISPTACPVAHTPASGKTHGNQVMMIPLVGRGRSDVPLLYMHTCHLQSLCCMQTTASRERFMGHLLKSPRADKLLTRRCKPRRQKGRTGSTPRTHRWTTGTEGPPAGAAWNPPCRALDRPGSRCASWSSGLSLQPKRVVLVAAWPWSEACQAQPSILWVTHPDSPSHLCSRWTTWHESSISVL